VSFGEIIATLPFIELMKTVDKTPSFASILILFHITFLRYPDFIESKERLQDNLKYFQNKLNS
jgi:hypothetical protein